VSCGAELVLEVLNYPFLLPPDSSSKHVSTDTTFLIEWDIM